ncbi:MAG: hypothetical protein R3B57_07235 [Phycisphaerales bacterium]
MNEHDTYENGTPDELRGIESALNRLGDAERASAPHDFEARVLERVRAGADEAPRSIPIHRHRTTARPRVVARLSAIAALLAVVGGAWFALQRTTSTPPAADNGIRLVSLEESVGDLLAAESWLDDMTSVDTTAAQDEADQIDTMIGSPWELIDTLDAAMGGEAI